MIVTGVATVTVPAVTEKVAEVAPDETVTLDGRTAPLGDELSPTVTPVVGAAEERVTVQVDPAEGVIEVGLHVRLPNLGVWSIVTVPFVRETGIDAPVAFAAEPPVSWTVEDASGAVPDKVRVTVARTPFGSVAVFNPQAMHVELPVPVVQETDLLSEEAPEPAVTTAEEKSLVE